MLEHQEKTIKTDKNIGKNRFSCKKKIVNRQKISGFSMEFEKKKCYNTERWRTL